MKGEKNGIKCYSWLLKGHAQFAIRYSISLNILLFRNGYLMKERTIHSFSIQLKNENVTLSIVVIEIFYLSFIHLVDYFSFMTP